MLVCLASTPDGRSQPPAGRSEAIRARVTSVVDGDTIRVRASRARRGFYTVRLIGIDAPELKRPDRVECGGKQATSNMIQLTFASPVDVDGDHYFDMGTGRGRRVRLTTDATQGRFDRNGHLLAYVRTIAGTQLQLDQLTRGWARVDAGMRRLRRYELFRRAETSARAASHGVWSKCGGDFHRPV